MRETLYLPDKQRLLYQSNLKLIATFPKKIFLDFQGNFDDRRGQLEGDWLTSEYKKLVFILLNQNGIT